MSVLRIRAPGALSTPAKGRSSPVEWFYNADGSSPAWAGWVTARTAHVGRSTEGNPLADVTGLGRHLTQTGADSGTQIGMQDNGFYGQADRWLNPPGTQADIFADGVAGEMSIVQFIYHPGGAGTFNGMIPATGAGNTARAQLQANATYNAQSTSWYGTGNANCVGPTPIDARRATDVYMIGATFRLNAISNFYAFGDDMPFITALTATSTAGGAMGGPAWRIGSRSANTPNGSRVVLTVPYNRVITPAEIRLAQLGGLALLDNKGLR